MTSHTPGSENIPENAFSLRSPYGRRAIGMSVAAAVGGFLFGFDSSVINGAVDSIQGDFELTEAAVGLVVAIALLACAVGAVLAGNLSDRWGRLKGPCCSARCCSSSARSAPRWRRR